MTPPTGLYLHWPFCARICPYCDFTITRARDEDISQWVSVLLDDMRAFRELTGQRELVSLYFGGGTPSLLPASAVAALIEGADEIFGLAADAEITLEANPTDAEMAHFAGFRSAGVNRLSLGIQSFDDTQLDFLGRNHGGEEARRAAELTAQIFPQYTFDFIYALPEEGLAAWERRLDEILCLGAPHLSLYQLTVEAGTAYSKAVGRGVWQPLADEGAADLFELTQVLTARAGCPAYEVSNHARRGFEARHNALYWQGADWIGIGPGAHGRLTLNGARHASAGRPEIRSWPGLPYKERYESEVLDETARLMEQLAGALRTVRGLRLETLPEMARTRIETAAISLKQSGHLHEAEGHLVIPPRHRLITDYIVGRLVEAL